MTGILGQASPVAAIPSVSVTIGNTGEAVTAGQIAVQGADGLLYYGGDPNTVGGNMRPISNVATLTNQFLNSAAFKLPTRGVAALAAAMLSNGGYVVAWLDSTTFNFCFAIFSIAGVQQGATVILQTAGSANYAAITASGLTGGGFVVAWSGDTSPYTMYGVFDNNGAVVKAAAAIETGLSVTTSPLIVSAALAGGGFVLAYALTGGGKYNFGMYSATGVLSAGPTSYSSSAAVSGALALVPTAAGGFVVGYATTAGTYVRQYSNGGAQVGSTSVNIGVANGSIKLCALAGGGYAAVAGTTPTVSTFTSASVQAGTSIAVAGAYTSNPTIAIAALSNGDFVVATGIASTGYTTVSYWGGATGTQKLSISDTTLPLYNSSPIFAMGNKAGGVTIIGRGTSYDYMYSLDGSGNLISTATFPTSTYAMSGAFLPITAAFTNPSSTLAVYVSNVGSNIVAGVFAAYVQKLTVIGVYGASASLAAAVKVIVSGTVTLGAAFVQPWSVDANTAATPGQRMSVIGNLATLYGIQQQSTVTRRTIN
jgi:hypothetical protein